MYLVTTLTPCYTTLADIHNSTLSQCNTTLTVMFYNSLDTVIYGIEHYFTTLILCNRPGLYIVQSLTSCERGGPRYHLFTNLTQYYTALKPTWCHRNPFYQPGHNFKSYSILRYTALYRLDTVQPPRSICLECLDTVLPSCMTCFTT